MANPNPRKEFLKPFNTRTKKEQRKIAKMGGIKSGEVRKEKKLLSQIYAEILADKKGVDGKGKTLDKVIKDILDSNNFKTTSARVALIKEIREGTEGQKNILMNPDGSSLKTEGITVKFISANPKKKIDDGHTATK